MWLSFDNTGRDSSSGMGITPIIPPVHIGGGDGSGTSEDPTSLQYHQRREQIAKQRREAEAKRLNDKRVADNKAYMEKYHREIENNRRMVAIGRAEPMVGPLTREGRGATDKVNMHAFASRRSDDVPPNPSQQRWENDGAVACIHQDAMDQITQVSGHTVGASNSAWQERAAASLFPFPNHFKWKNKDEVYVCDISQADGMPDIGFGNEWVFAGAVEGPIASAYMSRFGPKGHMYEQLASLYSVSPKEAVRMLANESLTFSHAKYYSQTPQKVAPGGLARITHGHPVGHDKWFTPAYLLERMVAPQYMEAMRYNHDLRHSTVPDHLYGVGEHGCNKACGPIMRAYIDAQNITAGHILFDGLVAATGDGRNKEQKIEAWKAGDFSDVDKLLEEYYEGMDYAPPTSVAARIGGKVAELREKFYQRYLPASHVETDAEIENLGQIGEATRSPREQFVKDMCEAEIVMKMGSMGIGGLGIGAAVGSKVCVGNVLCQTAAAGIGASIGVCAGAFTAMSSAMCQEHFGTNKSDDVDQSVVLPSQN